LESSSLSYDGDNFFELEYGTSTFSIVTLGTGTAALGKVRDKGKKENVASKEVKLGEFLGLDVIASVLSTGNKVYGGKAAGFGLGVGKSVGMIGAKAEASVLKGPSEISIGATLTGSVGSVKVVVTAIVNFLNEKTLATLKGMKALPPDRWTILDGFMFTAQDVATKSGLPLEKVQFESSDLMPPFSWICRPTGPCEMLPTDSS